MKIIKRASGYTLSMTHEEWEKIGQERGWGKAASQNWEARRQRWDIQKMQQRRKNNPQLFSDPYPTVQTPFQHVDSGNLSTRPLIEAGIQTVGDFLSLPDEELQAKLDPYGMSASKWRMIVQEWIKSFPNPSV